MIETLRYGPSREHWGELRTPAGSAAEPLVVLIHGGFWRDRYRLDLMHPLADDLAARGLPSWNIEYRRVGPTGGNWFNTPADVAAAIAHVADRYRCLVVVGHSAGGHLALWHARNPVMITGVTVGLAAVSDVVDANRTDIGRDATANFFGGDVDDFGHRYTHAQPSRLHGRVVLVHGDADENVPVRQSLDARERLAIDRVEVLPDVDHFEVIDPSHHSWQITLDEIEGLRQR